MREGASLSSRELALDAPTLLILGHEGAGLRKNVERLCGEMVHIEGSGDSSCVDSLNVSVAGGILIHQLCRRGGGN